MKNITLVKMENIKGGFSLSGFLYGACQGFTAVGVFASPIGWVRVVCGGATIGCLTLG